MKVDVTKKTVELYAHERKALTKAAAILEVLSPHVDFTKVSRLYPAATTGGNCLVGDVRDIGTLVAAVAVVMTADEDTDTNPKVTDD